MAFPSRPGAPLPVRATPESLAPGRSLRAYLDALPAVKISVTREGWYAGHARATRRRWLHPGADARTLQLYAEGVEQPIAHPRTASRVPRPERRHRVLRHGHRHAFLRHARLLARARLTARQTYSCFHVGWLGRFQRAEFPVLRPAGATHHLFRRPAQRREHGQLLRRTSQHRASRSGPHGRNIRSDLPAFPYAGNITLQGVTAGQPHSVSAT